MGLLLLGVAIGVIFSPSAWASISDPRKCAVSTPAYCASHAAGRVAIAKIKAARHPVPPIQAHCDARGSLLRWRCRLNDSGGHGWNVSVVYRATSSGWRVAAVVLP